jgi:thioredoxin 2
MTACSDARATPGVVRCFEVRQAEPVPSVASGTPRCGICTAPLPWVVDSCDDGFSAVADESSLPVLVDLLGAVVRALSDGQPDSRTARPLAGRAA